MADRHLVLVGAGHAHLEVLRRLPTSSRPKCRITLVTPSPTTAYSGMLPGVVAGLYAPGDMQIDVARLAAAGGTTLVLDEAVGLDLAGRSLHLARTASIPFDVLSLDIGARPALPDVRDAASSALPVKPIDVFLARFEVLRRRLAADRHRGHLAVVGAGAAGVELVLALERRLRADARSAGHASGALALSLVTDADDVLPGFPERCRADVGRLLARRGIAVHAGTAAIGQDADALLFTGGVRFPVDAALWCTPACAAPWLAESGLALDGRGFVRVDGNLRAVGRTHVFAVGDTAAFDPAPLPKSGVYAVRAAPILAHNLTAAMVGAPLRRFRPQARALWLLSTADGRAIAIRSGVCVSGRWVWTLKDWIDRRFVARYRLSSHEARPAGPGEGPSCATRFPAP